jgi:formate dehydrogenase subunit beta
MKTFVPVENGDTLQAVRGVLRRILESGQVEALMVPLRTPAGTVMPALVTDPALLDQADPLAPVYPVNAARALGWMTQREPRGRIGAVMRSCEMRAMIELVKLKQACVDCITLISVDCAGTYDVPVYLDAVAQPDNLLWPLLFDDPLASGSNGGPALRDACQMCERPVYDEAQVVVQLLGHDLAKGFSVVLPDEMAGALNWAPASDADGRRAMVDKLVAQRTARRDAVLCETRDKLNSGRPGEGLQTLFAACIRCHNCMTACPICYCKTCLFKGPVFDHDPIQYMTWAKRKGALRLPSDTMLFHLTRLNHMALSCIGCGACTSVCPVDIPVGRVFRAVGGNVQSVFDYVPGFNPQELLPLVAFQAEEWQEVGE